MKKLLTSLVLAVKLFSCGGEPDFPIGAFSIENHYNFMLKSSKNPLYNNALVSSNAYNYRKGYYLDIRDDLNLDEWSKHLSISKDEAKRIVYGKKSPIAIKDSKIQRYFLEYKKLMDMRDWDDKDFQNMLKEAQRLNQKAPDGFFKLRTAYFIIKAMHNLKMFDEELKLIDSLDRTMQKKSIVWEWIDSFKAGAVKNKGDLVKASYLFSKVFATHKSDAYIGYYDFEIKSDEQWQQLLNLAKSDEEKTLFHFLRSLKNRFSMIKELEYMLKIDKDSIWTKRLFMMVAQRVQFHIFENYDDDEKKYVADFMKLLQNHHDSEFSNYVYAYFTLLLDNKLIDKNLNKKQKKLLRYIYSVKNLKILDEKELSKELQDMEKFFSDNNTLVEDIKTFTIAQVTKFYKKGTAKRILASEYIPADEEYEYYEFRDDFQEWENMKELEAFINKPNKTYIEKLIAGSKANAYNKNFAKLSHSIYLTQKGKFKEALKIAQELPKCPKDFNDVYDWGDKDRQRASRENPFNINKSGDNRNYDYTYFYPQTKFLKTMINIKKQLKKNPNSDMDNYLYATGLYNISFYGNSPMLGMMFKSCSSVSSGSLETLPEAKKYYQKVLEHSKNKELLAKTYYQLMKIDYVEKMLKFQESEHHELLDLEPYEDKDFMKFSSYVISDNKAYKQHYKKLQEYKDTKFYNKIKGCAVFRFFK